MIDELDCELEMEDYNNNNKPTLKPSKEEADYDIPEKQEQGFEKNIIQENNGQESFMFQNGENSIHLQSSKLEMTDLMRLSAEFLSLDFSKQTKCKPNYTG